MTDTTIEDTGLHRPGVMFDVDGYKFLSRGTTGAPEGKLNVIRLESASEDRLSINQLVHDYEDGSITRLKTVPVDND